jgi:hypothetical protein
MGAQRVLLSIRTGAFLQVIAFLFLLLQGSTQPTTIWRTVVGYTQAPSEALLRLIDHFTATPVAHKDVTVIFVIVFLVQTTVFALPVWMLISALRNKANTRSSTPPSFVRH